jgi:hypothetical protein
VTGKYRAELRKLLGEPPDIKNIPDSFWDRVEREMEEEVAMLLLLMFIMSATRHGAPKAAANIAAASFAEQRAKDVARGLVETGKELVENSTDKGEAIRKVFGPERIEKIVISEATTAESAGTEIGVKSSVDELKKTGKKITVERFWWHNSRRPPRHSKASIDPCPICTPLDGKKLKDLPKQYQNGPPAHPNCDCFKRVVIYADGEKAREFTEKQIRG